MKSKGGFFRGFIVFLLVMVIFGGVGFLGYNIIFKGNMQMNMSSGATTENTDNTVSSNTKSTNMNQNNSEEVTDTTENEYIVAQVNLLTENKQLLSKAIKTIQSSVDQMSQETYKVAGQQDSKKQDSNSNQQKDVSSDSSNNTTINIYTEQIAQPTQTQDTTGQTYDADKMQSLHTGIYKASLGIQLLIQVSDNIDSQINKASINSTSKTEYYINQYNATLQNKNVLEQAQGYISDAIELLNINPYVDANGLAYSSIDMAAMHESLDSYAKAVVEINQLNTNMLNQTVQLGTMAQTANNQENQTQMTTSNNMNMTSSMSSGFLSNLNISSIFTVILVVFVVIFIIGLLGAVSQIFKTGKTTKEETDSLI